MPVARNKGIWARLDSRGLDVAVQVLLEGIVDCHFVMPAAPLRSCSKSPMQFGRSQRRRRLSRDKSARIRPH